MNLFFKQICAVSSLRGFDRTIRIMKYSMVQFSEKHKCVDSSCKIDHEHDAIDGSSDKEKFTFTNSLKEGRSNVISLNENNIFKAKLSLSNEIDQKPLIENEMYRELYKNFSVYTSEDLMRSLDRIPHDEKIDDIEYKYGLPAKNEKAFGALIELKEEKEELPLTDTENLFALLDLDKLSSYESLVVKLQQELNHEADMYGNVVKAGDTDHAVFQYGIPIPMDVIKNERFMTKVRQYRLYNVDLPGNIEDVHPNKFIANLRPIEEFRHTPVVPIPEKDLKEYKKKIEDKNRIGVYFEVKKQTLYYYGIAILFSLLLFRTFKYFYRESEKTQIEIEKIRFKRLRYREEEDIN